MRASQIYENINEVDLITAIEEAGFFFLSSYEAGLKEDSIVSTQDVSKDLDLVCKITRHSEFFDIHAILTELRRLRYETSSFLKIYSKILSKAFCMYAEMDIPSIADEIRSLEGTSVKRDVYGYWIKNGPFTPEEKKVIQSNSHPPEGLGYRRYYIDNIEEREED